MQGAHDRFIAQRSLRWAIVPLGSSSSVGTVSLTVKAGDPFVAELGVVVGRADWSKGIGAAGAGLAVGYGFAQLGLREVQAHVLERNPASIRLLEKLDFHFFGVLAPTADEPEELLLYRLVASQETPSR